MLHVDTKSLHLALASAPAFVLFHIIPEERARQGTNYHVSLSIVPTKFLNLFSPSLGARYVVEGEFLVLDWYSHTVDRVPLKNSSS